MSGKLHASATLPGFQEYTIKRTGKHKSESGYGGGGSF